MLKFFRFAFGLTGDRAAVPDTADVGGSVSYQQGYGFDYQRDMNTDPSAKNIERDKMNQLWFDVTNAIAELQTQGVPDFITSALNGGSAYSYGQYSIVRYSGNLYISLVAANTALPTDATKWALLPTPERVRDGVNVIAASGGTVDAVTLALTPTQTAFSAGPAWWRATGANTSTVPTVKRDALAAKTLVKGNNLPLVAGDIPGAGAWMVSQYDVTLDREVLLNPATGVSIAAIPDATTSVKGKVALATSAEVTTGTNADKAVTPVSLSAAGIVAVPQATTSVKGISQLATSAEVTTGADTAKTITPAALKNATLVQASIGFGQTYTDVTASRALAITYTNSLARPILVSVDVNMSGGTAQLIATVAGSPVAWSNTQPSGYATGVQFIVPPGATYSVSPSTANHTLDKWFELK